MFKVPISKDAGPVCRKLDRSIPGVSLLPDYFDGDTLAFPPSMLDAVRRLLGSLQVLYGEPAEQLYRSLLELDQRAAA